MGIHLNFVHNDEIWKDHVRHEMQALTRWPEKWGYLRQEYRKMNRILTGLPPESPEPEPKEIPLRAAPEQMKLPPITSGIFPVTTAKQIGWKSAKPECQLEIYGRYAPKARGKKGLLKSLKWPQQGF